MRDTTHSRVLRYVAFWRARGYPDGIPDEVPDPLMHLGIAPSYKAICYALLRNDLALCSLGFSVPESPWYGELKRRELAERRGESNPQLCLWKSS